PRLYPEGPRDGAGQRRHHRQHGLGAVQARRLRGGVRLPRPRLSARSRPGDRRAPHRRALGARRAGRGARAARDGARARSGQPSPERNPAPAAGMIRFALLVAALLSTTGCGPRALVEHDGLGFDERRARLTAIPAWEMRGRIAVDTGERGFPATFRWRQEGERSTLVIRGPFGAGAVEVTGSPERMIVRARGEQQVLEDPETDLSALLGWWVPVESLRAWLLGVPDPAYEARTRIGRANVLTELEQRLWRLDYEGYQLAEGLLVPRRIDMSYDELAVRLRVDDWATRPLNSTASEQHNTALGAAHGRWGVAKR